MSLNNECTCKRVLVFPKVEEPKKVLIFARTPISSNTNGSNVDLSNYYTKKQTDDMLAKKLSTSELDNAIDQALLEAKESGEFQGEKGEQGVAGKDGKDGANGISATHSWSGTTLTITSASGTSSANLKGERGERGERGLQGEQGVQGIQGIQGEKGENGKDGYTPVKGTDYFTNADKQEFIADITPTIENTINQAIGEIEYGTY